MDVFRRLMGIQPHQYKSYTMIRKRVLDVAVEEINSKTDIEITFETEKKGRKIIALNFKMFLKKSQTFGIEQSGDIKQKLKNF